MNQKNKANGVITIALVAVFLGLLAGIAGQLIAREYLFKDWYGLPFGSELNLTQTGLNSPNLVIKGAENISVEQDKKVRETINSASQNLVGIFPKKEGLLSSEKDLGNINIDNYYDLNDNIAQGLIITSDGWILLPEKNKIRESGDFVAITKEKEIYEIDRIREVADHSFSFLHLKDAKELPVKKFTSRKEVVSGDLVVALNWQEKGFLTSVVDREQKSGLVRSSDVFRETIQVADEVPDYFDSAFLFNLKGGVAGVYDGQKRIQSINNFRVYIQNLLKQESETIPSLGINYVDLSRVLLTSDSADEYEKGALIYPDNNGVAVKEGSIAAAKGLQQGDIITAVNNKEINKDTSLNYLISGHTVGENITLTYLRDGDSHTISLTLKGIKNKYED